MNDFQTNQSEKDEEGTFESLRRSKMNLRNALMVFIILFIFSSGMLIYYQFYQGHGSWRFTWLHKSNDTTLLLAIKSSARDTIHPMAQKVIPVKKDSLLAKTDSVISNETPVSKIKDDSIVNGTVYEVQVGTFENYELKKYHAVFNNLHEEKRGNLTRLTLGRFLNEKEADAFKRDMMRLGIKDAWVVKKVNGKRE